MRILRRRTPPFAPWAVGLVGVAAVADFAHFTLWEIAAFVLGGGALIAVVERSRSRARAQSASLTPYIDVEDRPGSETPLEAPHPSEDAEAQSDVLKLGDEPPGAMPNESVAERQAERTIELRSAAILSNAKAHAVGTVVGHQWNLWDLDRLAHEKAADNEEIAFLLFYLRDFADPEGFLPSDFEPLVRETFGSLLPAVVA